MPFKDLPQVQTMVAHGKTTHKLGAKCSTCAQVAKEAWESIDSFAEELALTSNYSEDAIKERIRDIYQKMVMMAIVRELNSMKTDRYDTFDDTKKAKAEKEAELIIKSL